MFREKTSFFKKRNNTVQSIDNTKVTTPNNNEIHDNTAKRKSNLKPSKSEDFSRSQQPTNSESKSESRLKGSKNNTSSLNEQTNGSFKGDSNSSTESTMSVAKTTKTPRRGVYKVSIDKLTRTTRKHKQYIAFINNCSSSNFYISSIANFGF